MQERNIPSETDALVALLRRLASSVEHGILSIANLPKPTLEILNLIQDLSLQLSELVTVEYRNKSVFEDPLNRSDALGNVRMIHKNYPQNPLFFAPLLTFAEQTVQEVARLKQYLGHSQSFQDDLDAEWAELERSVYQADEIVVALESRQSTRRLISRLYKEYWRDKREIRKLLRYQEKLHRSLRAKKSVISKLHQRLQGK